MTIEIDTEKHTLKVKSKNNVLYGQDFQSKLGLPVGVEFEVSWFEKNQSLTLRAEGYGGKEDYGNGCIHLPVESLFPFKEKNFLGMIKE